ncbi:cellulose binding domain-containing protein [Saccharothrix sp.]|uniref:cellulose binding domain-containing protein n=1 Tax=Saccharothrix sp. TaxID=1873460 RepID=UPI00281277F8|nr:cellulose binding domain-containing protein [Saccharothrix sp.]
MVRQTAHRRLLSGRRAGFGVSAVVVALAATLTGLAPGQARADVPEVVVDHGGAGQAVMPGSGSAVVKVSLSAPPPTSTTVTIARDVPSPVFVSSRRTLTFTPTDWNVPRSVRMISLRDFGPGEFTVTGPGVAGGVIRVYSSTMPLPPNVNQACRVALSSATFWNGGFFINATITNSGPTPLTDWTLTALFSGDEKVTSAGTGDWGQYGRGAAFPAPSWRRQLLPGESVSVGFVATSTHASIVPSLRCVPEPYLLTTPPTTTVPD